MTFSTRLAFLSVAALGLTISLAGCGADDNEKVGQLNADGTPTKVINSGPTKSADEIYKETQKNTGTSNAMQSKEYKR